MNFWEMYFPAPGKAGGLNKTAAFEWLIALAHARGIYDPRRVRGRGAWNDKGRVVFHHGNHLSVDGVHTEISGVKSSWPTTSSIYCASAPSCAACASSRRRKATAWSSHPSATVPVPRPKPCLKPG